MNREPTCPDCLCAQRSTQIGYEPDHTCEVCGFWGKAGEFYGPPPILPVLGQPRHWEVTAFQSGTVMVSSGADAAIYVHAGVPLLGETRNDRFRHAVADELCRYLNSRRARPSWTHLLKVREYSPESAALVYDDLGIHLTAHPSFAATQNVGRQFVNDLGRLLIRKAAP